MTSRSGYAVDQFSPVLTSTGKQKHMNLILYDRSVENSKTYGWEQPSHGYSMSLGRRASTAPSPYSTSKSLTSTSKPQRSPEEEEAYQEALESRQMAYQVRGRRAPAGQFFGPINGTLFEKEPPPSTYQSKNLTEDAYQTMRAGTAATGGRPAAHASNAAADGSGSCASGYHMGEETAVKPPSPRSQIARAQAATAAAAAAPAQPTKPANYVPSWTLPWQTGDRVAGRQMAMSIRAKRTPTGAFAVMDLPKSK